MQGPDSTISQWRALAAPPTAARVYYAYKIVILPGATGSPAVPIGTFQNFAPRSTRPVFRNRGICNNGGIPHELVPGPSDLTITVQYLSLYARALTQAIGFGVLGSSLEQNLMHLPFDIIEQIMHPPSLADSYNLLQDPTRGVGDVENDPEQVVYRSCVISDMGRTIATGTVHIVETATIQCQYSYVPTLRRAQESGDQVTLQDSADPLNPRTINSGPPGIRLS